jgi:hypothetical protein
LGYRIGKNERGENMLTGETTDAFTIVKIEVCELEEPLYNEQQEIHASSKD